MRLAYRHFRSTLRISNHQNQIFKHNNHQQPSLLSLQSQCSQLNNQNAYNNYSTAITKNSTITPQQQQQQQHLKSSYAIHPPKQHYSTTSSVSLSSLPPHTLFPMPALSPTMTTGTISKWNKSPGESFSAGDILCEIETDKATVEFEAQDDGILAKILKEGNDAVDLEVGVPICVVVDEGVDLDAFRDFVVDNDASSTSSTASSTASSETASATSSNNTTSQTYTSSNTPSFLTPAARHMSQSKGLDATVLTGTGKGGRVTKEDLINALKNGVQLPPLSKSSSTTTTTISSSSSSSVSTTSTPTPQTTPAPTTSTTTTTVEIPSITTSGTYTDIPNNNMRKVIARRLTESKSTVPHYYTTIQIPIDNILSLRKSLASKHDIKISVNDVIIKSCALALRDNPQVNSSFNDKTQSITYNPSNIDISIAVATPTGLITPIIPQTNTLGLNDISNQVKDLASRAKVGKLLPNEYQGGTFCISNLGMFGIDEFSAVINPPQACILAVGGGVKTIVSSVYSDEDDDDNVVSLEEKKAKNKPMVQTLMTARLSADGRVVDEATAALFLSSLKYYLSKPELLML